MFRYLDKQPLADTLMTLQTQVDAFDRIYNTERPHQGLPGRVTPETAWNATSKADPPRPNPEPQLFARTAIRPDLTPADLPTEITLRRLNSAGTFTLARVIYIVGGQYRLQQVLVVVDGDKIAVSNLDGEILIEHIRPPAGVTYVGNGRPRGPRPEAQGPRTSKRYRCPDTPTVTEVLMQIRHRCPETSHEICRRPARRADDGGQR